MADIVKVSRILGQSQEQTATLRDELTPLRALLQGVQDVTSTVGATDGCACPLLQELNLLLERAQMLPPENGAQPVMGGTPSFAWSPSQAPRLRSGWTHRRRQSHDRCELPAQLGPAPGAVTTNPGLSKQLVELYPGLPPASRKPPGDGKDPRRRQDNVPPRNSGPDVTHSLEEARWIVSGLHLA